MADGRERFVVPAEMGGETIEKVYARELEPVPIREYGNLPEAERRACKPYPFEQRVYQAAPGILCEQDVGVAMRDGTILYADVFRPSEGDAKVPAILAWSNYGKRCNEYREGDEVAYTPGVPVGAVSPLAKFEAVDPEYWCREGYAVINVDIRGIGYSGGFHEQFGKQDAEDGYDFIEWVASRAWCNGRVAMAGSSALAISQWHIAAEQPPHLACIAPWEGMSDLYRESLCEGGIPCVRFTNFATAGACGLNGIDDMGAMAEKYPLMNGYWQDKIPDFSRIVVPAYVCAGWNHFHLRGSVIGWRKMASERKWLRVHREFEWPDFYSREGIADLKAFFDRFCKNVRNGWDSTPQCAHYGTGPFRRRLAHRSCRA